MKMKKLLFTCAAVAGVSLALGATAFADVIENNAGYNKTEGTYSVSSDLSGYVTNEVPDQMTIIIIPEKAYNAAKINDSDILYIDQTAAGKSIFQNVGILGGKTLADGTYYVKIGGENIAQDGIIVEKFTVTTTPEGTTITRLYGDVNGDDWVDSDDAIEVICYEIGLDSVFDDGAAWRETAGDVNQDTWVDSDDAIEIICYEIGLDSVFDSMESDSFEYSEE